MPDQSRGGRTTLEPWYPAAEVRPDMKTSLECWGPRISIEIGPQVLGPSRERGTSLCWRPGGHGAKVSSRPWERVPGDANLLEATSGRLG